MVPGSRRLPIRQACGTACQIECPALHPNGSVSPNEIRPALAGITQRGPSADVAGGRSLPGQGPPLAFRLHF